MTDSKILTKDQLMGLILSTESSNLDDDKLEQAIKDWDNYYSTDGSIDFGWILCHLITKADLSNLNRITKGFPEYVRIFVEKAILADIEPDKIKEIMNNEQ